MQTSRKHWRPFFSESPQRLVSAWWILATFDPRRQPPSCLQESPSSRLLASHLENTGETWPIHLAPFGQMHSTSLVLQMKMRKGDTTVWFFSKMYLSQIFSWVYRRKYLYIKFFFKLPFHFLTSVKFWSFLMSQVNIFRGFFLVTSSTFHDHFLFFFVVFLDEWIFVKFFFVTSSLNASSSFFFNDVVFLYLTWFKLVCFFHILLPNSFAIFIVLFFSFLSSSSFFFLMVTYFNFGFESNTIFFPRSDLFSWFLFFGIVK